MRRATIAGNWKMHGTKRQAHDLLQGIKDNSQTLDHVELIVLPPFIFIEQTAQALNDSHVAWGAQNVSNQEQGAFTGEVSASMLAEFACRYALVGHSERRTIYNESDAVVREKFSRLQASNICPILCMGESLEQRRQNQTQAVVQRQIDAILDTQGVSALQDAILAYEPIWAIGTGESASPEQAQEVHSFIRHYLAEHNAKIAQNIRILYGGSVKPTNARDLFAMPDIDGGLIGGASLESDSFIAIANAVSPD